MKLYAAILISLSLLLILFLSIPTTLKTITQQKISADTLNKCFITNNKKICGPIALKMIFDYYKILSTVDEIENRAGVTKNGTSMRSLLEIAESKGLHAEGWRLTTEDLVNAIFPVILYINGNHYIVADSIIKKELYVRDPNIGNLRYNIDGFGNLWKGETLIFRNSTKKVKG
jgi:ABC-type bacteriocin/lantibiotic exporter with double-glycine peptidase domain